MKKKSWLWLLLLVPPVALMVLFSPKGSGSTVRVTDANPALQAAVKEAQARLPEFVARLKVAQSGDRFAIKGRFPVGADWEYLWVKAPLIKGDDFEGTLDQDPIAYRKAKKGDSVVIKKADVYDWMMRIEGHTTGAFTEQALQGIR